MAARYLITGGGSVTWDASNTAIWSASSGGATGASVPGASDDVIMDASSGGGTVTLAYSPTVISITCGAFTGTFAFSSFSPNIGTFNYSGTGTRTINMGSSTPNITGNAATVWNGSTATNLTFVPGTSTVCFTYSGGTGTRTITGHPTGGNMPNIKITAGTDTVGLGLVTGAPGGDVDWTGFSGTASSVSASPFFTGNFTLSPTMTVATSTQAFSYVGTGTKTFNANGLTNIDKPLMINSTGTLLLVNNLSLTPTKTTTLTAGTLDFNGYDLMTGLFASSNSNTRAITLRTSRLILTAPAGTIFNTAVSTNLTVNAGTGTIVVTDKGASGKTLSGGGTTYWLLYFRGVLASLTLTSISFSQGEDIAEYNAGMRTTQEYLNDKAGTVGLTKGQALERLVGLPGVGAQVAANNYAGTQGRTIQGALNVKAGTVGLTTQDASRRI